MGLDRNRSSFDFTFCDFGRVALVGMCCQLYTWFGVDGVGETRGAHSPLSFKPPYQSLLLLFSFSSMLVFLFRKYSFISKIII